MKQTRLVKILAAGFGCAAALGGVLAQETTTTTTTTNPVTGTTTTESATTTTTGTITAYTPDSDYIMFRTEPGVAPVRYYYTNGVRSVPEYLRLRYDHRAHLLNATSFAVVTVLMAGIDMFAFALIFRAAIAIAAPATGVEREP